MDSRSKKIGMLIFKYPLGISLSLINSAILLAREGYEVHIFIDKASFDASRIHFNEKNIRIHTIETNKEDTFNTSILNRLFSEKSSYYSSMGIINYGKYIFIFKELFKFYRKTLDYIDDKYACIFGADAFGLIAATLVAKSFSKKTEIPVIYYNLELLLDKECNSLTDKVLKSLERECNKRSILTIIQDERRAKYLIKDNGVPENKFVYVPVSALGDIYQNKSDYLHRTLDVPKSKKIILYAGTIMSEFMCLEIAETAQNWDDGVVLVLHTWRADSSNDPYVHKIRGLTRNKKVYLSLNPVERESLPELLSSADIGLVFYQNLGGNFYETGYSSNKLAQYLQVGLPVITSDYPSFREVIGGYRCGECAKGPDEIEKLAREIFSDYDSYRNNAFKCYQEKYEFSKYFKVVIDKLKDMGV